MSLGARRHSGLQRGQTEREETPPGLRSLRAHARCSDNGGDDGRLLKTGDKLRSGITLTFPEDQQHQHKQANSRDDAKVQTGMQRVHTREIAQSQARSQGGAKTPRFTPRNSDRRSRPRGSNQEGQQLSSVEDFNNSGSSTYWSRRQGGTTARSISSGHASESSTSDEELQNRMAQLQAAQQSRAWLVITWLRQMELEKDKADELSKQMALQAQALIEERAKMKAEKDQLERSHNEMAARLELLEGLIVPDEDFQHGGDEQDLLQEEVTHQ